MPAKKLKTENSKLKTKAKKSKVNKKTVTTEAQEKRLETLKSKLSVSSSDSAAARKASQKTKIGAKVGLKVDVYNTKGNVSGEIELPKEIFGAKINQQLIAQAVRVYLMNQRSGTASTKTRGEVAGSTRKIYKQKGTGRARHGSIRAPIFVKGGVVFGPRPRDYSLKLSKKMKKASLFSALSLKYNDKEIKIVEDLSDLESKTKLMFNVFKNLGLENQKILLVLPNTGELNGEKRENTIRAVRNIKNLNYIGASNLNAYEALNNNVIVFPKEAVESVIKSFQTKEK